MAGYGKVDAKAIDVKTIFFAFRRLLMALNDGTPFSISFSIYINVIVTNVSC